jgi:hypothetical protein
MYEQTHTRDLRTRNWPAYNEALKLRASLTIWFDPDLSWDAAPTGRRGRQQTVSDAEIQKCLSMKGEGRPGNAHMARFSPERAEPRPTASTLLGAVGILQVMLDATLLTQLVWSTNNAQS